MCQGCRVRIPSEVGELVAPSFFENRFNGIIILTECGGMMTPHELMFHDTTVLLVSALADTTTLTTTFGSCRFSEFRSGPSVVFKCAYATSAYWAHKLPSFPLLRSWWVHASFWQLITGKTLFRMPTSTIFRLCIAHCLWMWPLALDPVVRKRVKPWTDRVTRWLWASPALVTNVDL